VMPLLLRRTPGARAGARALLAHGVAVVVVVVVVGFEAELEVSRWVVAALCVVFAALCGVCSTSSACPSARAC
jgi:hypothetical protein